MRRSDTNIKTERLWLREIDETDAEAIVELRSDEDVYKYFLNPEKLTVEKHRAWYNEQYKTDETRIDWMAVDDETGEFIGVYGAKIMEDDLVEISYITSPKHKGQGYAREAVDAILLFCLKVFCTKNAIVHINRQNVASISFAKKLGFANEISLDEFVLMKKELVGTV